jgi:hypothetical protein
MKKQIISSAKIVVLVSLSLVLILIASCKKETETIEKQNINATLEDFNPKTSLTEKEYFKFKEEEAEVLPAIIKYEEIGASKLQLKATPTPVQCSPAVSFDATWNSAQTKYNCTSSHNLCTLADYSPNSGYYYVGSDYFFKTYWCMTEYGDYQEGELNTGWQINDYNVTFNINNPISPGKYYFVRCLWRNVYYSESYGWYVQNFVVDSRVTYLPFISPPPPAFSVRIAGPIKGYNNLQYTWTAMVTNGTGTITYQWYRSLDQGQTYPILFGSGKTFTNYLPNGLDLYLKVNATATNGTASDEFLTLNLGNKP